MEELNYNSLPHHHDKFLAKAKKRKGFLKAYDSLAEEYAIVREMLLARSKSGLTQEVVAKILGTTKSAVSRLESTGKHSPSQAALKKYAKAVGCHLEVRFVPKSSSK